MILISAKRWLKVGIAHIRSIFNMTKKNGSQRGFVYMGYIDKGYDDIMCSSGPVTEPLTEFWAEI